ncbi:MAG TPA: DUF3179 domain-containing (seleno)protein, partial [Chthonomonadales bacterium]|nr:DUF3179 domain-containing (seleno)protein [Chthonomonadales bacterium]
MNLRNLLYAAVLAAAAGLAMPGAAQQPPLRLPPAVTAASTGLTVAPGINAADLLDLRSIAPFHTLDAPPMVPAAAADFLDDSDYVLGITMNGESRAYPTRYVWWHHAINDRIGSSPITARPIAVTYCSVCNTGIAYNPGLQGKTRLLDFYGLYQGVVTLIDRQSQSVFLQADGRFVSGPLMGKSLKTYPLLDTTWGEWKKLHPDSLVMSPNTAYQAHYHPKGIPEPRGYDQFPLPFFAESY